MTYHDLEHLSPPFPRLGEEVAIFLETEAQEGLLLYEKDGEVLQKPMARVPGGLKAQVAVAQSPFRYLFRLPEGYWGSHGLEKALPRYDRFFHLLAHPLPPEWALGTVFYQIFPDRFRQGPKDLAPRDPGARILEEWNPKARPKTPSPKRKAFGA
jgi:alpha-glucosidase